MKCFKVLSVVALLAPGISFADDAAHSAAPAHHETAPAAAVPTTAAPAAEHSTVNAKPAVKADAKANKKAKQKDAKSDHKPAAAK
jgi:hypothetical protein